MPVTKTAKRALRSSKRKEIINKLLVNKLEAAIRLAKKTKTKANLLRAISLADKVCKKGIIHRNKAARIKSKMSKLLPKVAKTKKASK